MRSKFYEFSARALNGQEVGMENYAGKTILVVNTASKCGLTPQYEGLEVLYQKYKDKDFVILGFPCNQFGNQEPGDETSILDFCSTNYGVSFPIFTKIDVNGETAHPIFQFLKNRLKGIGGNEIKWNFTKFLIDPEGNPVKRFSPLTKPEEIDKYISRYVK